MIKGIAFVFVLVMIVAVITAQLKILGIIAREDARSIFANCIGFFAYYCIVHVLMYRIKL